jgi:hypothetical protein
MVNQPYRTLRALLVVLSLMAATGGTGFSWRLAARDSGAVYQRLRTMSRSFYGAVNQKKVDPT